MDDIKKYIKILDNMDLSSLMQELYFYAEERLKRNMSFEEFESLFKGYLIYSIYTEKDRFNFCELKEILKNKAFLKSLVFDFVVMVNGQTAKVAQLMDENECNELLDLEEYRNDPLYEELSEEDQLIGMIIKDEFCYVTIGDIKNGAYLTNGYNIGNYVLTKEEIAAIERVHKLPNLNELAHLMYDERIDTIYEYKEDETDPDIMRKLIVCTGKNNPEYEIIFPDGSIINYRNGYIRKKPYTYLDIITYTKLYLIAYYNEIEEEIEAYTDHELELIDPELYETIRFQDKIESAFNAVISRIISLEDIYTKPMIDSSKEEYNKVKKIVKDYNL